MRSIRCWYSIKSTPVHSPMDHACWGGLWNYAKGTVMYIDKYAETETKEFVNLIVDLINKITPCEFKEVNGIKCISYTILDGYDKNLILLNFIRYLWCPYPNDFLKGNSYYEFDTNKFFETLRDDKTYKDSLERLLYANQQAVTGTGSRLPPGHSNIHNPSKLKIKTSKQLLEWKGSSTQSFLTSD